MVPCRLLTTVGVMVALVGFSSEADADGGGAKKKHHVVHGRVTEVASDGNTFTIEFRPHPKKNAPAPATSPASVEKKFKVDKDTKIVFVSGKKGEREFTPATFADLHKGEHVVVLFRSGQAEVADRVAIVKHKKQSI
jgi:hypothetical protein